MPVLCHAFGFRVATEVPIPGAVFVDLEEPISPELLIVRGGASLSVEEKCSAPSHSGPPRSGPSGSGPYRLGPEGLLFEKPGVARYLCGRAGDRLTVDAMPGAPESEVAAYLIATALPALLWMRGEIVLHGAVAVLPGHREAIALLGESGSGKSMLLKQIVEAGGIAVAEDSFRLWQAEGRFLAAGLPGRIHLRHAGASLEAERSAWDVRPAQCRASEEIAAMIVLEPWKEHGKNEPEPEGIGGPIRLRGVSALGTILRHQHRARVPELMGVSGDLLPRCAAIAKAVPVYSWEFLRATLRPPGSGGTWRTLAGFQSLEDWRE